MILLQYNNLNVTIATTPSDDMEHQFIDVSIVTTLMSAVSSGKDKCIMLTLQFVVVYP